MAKKKPEPDSPAPSTEFPLLKDDSAPHVSEKSAPAPAGGASEPKAASAASTSADKPAGPGESSAPASGAPKIERVSFADRLREQTPDVSVLSEKALKGRSRRDFLIFGAGAVAAALGFWWVLPSDTQQRLGDRGATDHAGKERFLDRSLRVDDAVAEALYSPHRLVPTYSKSQVTPNLINNYNGATPDPGYLDDWKLTVAGLASGKIERLNIHQLLARFAHHEQITRLVCVEGWSAIAWWGGLRFADFLKAYPPMPGARWARLDSAVNLDADGNPDPYYVSIDLPTARHPQTLLATHNNGAPLGVDHGAPLRLVAPMKLGLKNIKAITKITYTAIQPADYWAERGYSKYDGV